MTLFIRLFALLFIIINPGKTHAQTCPIPPPGDANQDCRVDGLDYSVWLNNYNHSTTKGAENGDFNNDGFVDGLDYVIWFKSYKDFEITPTDRTDKTSPTPSENDIAVCLRPYKENSPWNTPIGPSPKIHPNSDKIISGLPGSFGPDPFIYAYPVYHTDRKLKLKKIKYTGYYRYVTDDERRIITNKGENFLALQIPDDALPSDDGNLIILDKDSGVEWNITKAIKEKDGSWSVKDIYKYNIRHSGFAAGPFSRENGTPFLAGLIRSCEIKTGIIKHAIAFSYKHQKNNASPFNIPRGTRLQLDPDSSAEKLKSWCGNDKVCQIMVKAMQKYGMYPVGFSDSPKIFVENQGSARWENLLENTVLGRIPFSAFKIVIPK